ncbi:hypothetical protein Bca101_075575 [Brassica carinata]
MQRLCTFRPFRYTREYVLQTLWLLPFLSSSVDSTFVYDVKCLLCNLCSCRGSVRSFLLLDICFF